MESLQASIPAIRRAGAIGSHMRCNGLEMLKLTDLILNLTRATLPMYQIYALRRSRERITTPMNQNRIVIQKNTHRSFIV